METFELGRLLEYGTILMVLVAERTRPTSSTHVWRVASSKRATWRRARRPVSVAAADPSSQSMITTNWKSAFGTLPTPVIGTFSWSRAPPRVNL